MKKKMEIFRQKAGKTGQKLAVLKMVCTLCVAIGWWGMLYPDFTMTPDTYQVVWKEDAVQQEQSMLEWDSEDEIYDLIMKADSGQIRFKSRLLEKLDAILKYFR